VLAALSVSVPAALAVLAAMVLYQELESRILVPRIYGRVLRLSPAVVIVALLVGATLLGVVGALLALPCAAALRMIVKELRVELPGEKEPSTTLRMRQAAEEQEYAQRAADAPAEEAVQIAKEMTREPEE
jgi:predicted PurR-regulated permease PerM